MNEEPDAEAVAETRAILEDAPLMRALREAQADVEAGRVFEHGEIAELVRRRQTEDTR